MQLDQHIGRVRHQLTKLVNIRGVFCCCVRLLLLGLPPLERILGDMGTVEAQGAHTCIGVMDVACCMALREEEFLVVIGALERELKAGGGVLFCLFLFLLVGGKSLIWKEKTRFNYEGLLTIGSLLSKGRRKLTWI